MVLLISIRNINTYFNSFVRYSFLLSSLVRSFKRSLKVLPTIPVIVIYNWEKVFYLNVYSFKGLLLSKNLPCIGQNSV